MCQKPRAIIRGSYTAGNKQGQNPGALQSLFRNTINLDLIIEQWDELVRLPHR